MIRRWCIPLAGLALVAGTVAASAPAAAARTPHSVAGHVIRPGAPMIRPGTNPMVGHGLPRRATPSQNWSGYAANGGTYHSVSANWTEPTGHCTSATRYSAFWVGLDGFNSHSVEQTGTSVDCVGGSPQYYGWYEMYPRNPVNFGNFVSPGDHFFGSVTYNGGSSYTLVLQDITQGWTHTVHSSLSGAANSSAEAIAEAPCCTAGGGILPLADFGTANFTNVKANGSAIGGFSPTEIVMVDGSGRAKDSVSSLTGGGNFSATWLRAT
jgi:hypothetical protein